ncbi:3'-5' exonuclease [Methanoculleus sp.]|uniref:3'-5' exonuclease n=1 Tax=Methanoculleus sp. TaxID=90427 RepID=UPI0025E3E980|nr:3'-5' exonuclease [Methanoculleus sp.]
MHRKRDQCRISAPPHPDQRAAHLIFDTETTGLPLYQNAPGRDATAWPRLVQIAWLLYDSGEHITRQECFTILPDGFTIPRDAVRVHGITTEAAIRSGIPLQIVLDKFREAAAQSSIVVAHNMAFDGAVVAAECARSGVENPLSGMPSVCTMEASVRVCGLRRPGGLKWPTLTELHRTLFGSVYPGAHGAGNDAAACARCFFELKRRGIIQ